MNNKTKPRPPGRGIKTQRNGNEKKILRNIRRQKRALLERNELRHYRNDKRCYIGRNPAPFFGNRRVPGQLFSTRLCFYLDNSRAKELVGKKLTQKDIIKLEEIEECLIENCVFFR